MAASTIPGRQGSRPRDRVLPEFGQGPANEVQGPARTHLPPAPQGKATMPTSTKPCISGRTRSASALSELGDSGLFSCLKTANGSEVFRAFAEDPVPARSVADRGEPGRLSGARGLRAASATGHSRGNPREGPCGGSLAARFARRSGGRRSDMRRGRLQAERDLAESRPGNVPALNVMAGHGMHIAEFPLRRVVVEYRGGSRHALQSPDGALA